MGTQVTSTRTYYVDILVLEGMVGRYGMVNVHLCLVRRRLAALKTNASSTLESLAGMGREIGF
jgi:hypothetical protein